MTHRIWADQLLFGVVALFELFEIASPSSWRFSSSASRLGKKSTPKRVNIASFSL